MTDTPKAPLMTREEIAAAAKAELGIPLKLSTINKLAAEGKGPTPISRFGNSFLYEREAALEWARSLLAPVATAGAR